MVKFGDIVANYGSEQPQVVTWSCKLSQGREVGQSDESTGARSYGVGALAAHAVQMMRLHALWLPAP